MIRGDFGLQGCWTILVGKKSTHVDLQLYLSALLLIQSGLVELGVWLNLAIMKMISMLEYRRNINYISDFNIGLNSILIIDIDVFPMRL